MSLQPCGTRVFIENLVVEIAVGHERWERYPGRRWPVRVDVEMYTSRTDWTGASMEDVVDYSQVRDYLTTWPERPHVELLETLAEDLLQFCFRDGKVSMVRVRIAKPNLYASGTVAGIEVCRDRVTK